MTLTLFIHVQHQYVLMGVNMAYVRIQISVPVMLDGKVLIAALALSYLGVYMEAAMAKDWLANVTIQMNGREAFVIYLFATIVSMATVLPRVTATAFQDGQDLTVINVCH